MPRSAPRDGYNFAQKEQYRREVWATLRQFCPVKPYHASVLFMPSSEGLEIKHILKRGFRDSQLYAVERSAAILAHATMRGWHKEHPRIRAHGVELTRAAEKIAAEGIALDVCNLDLCSNANQGSLEQLVQFGASGALAKKCVVALTVLRGRESGDVARLLRLGPQFPAGLIGDDSIRREHFGKLMDSQMARMTEVSGAYKKLDMDPGRMHAGFLAIAVGAKAALRVERMSIYRSGPSTMIWGVARFEELQAHIEGDLKTAQLLNSLAESLRSRWKAGRISRMELHRTLNQVAAGDGPWLVPEPLVPRYREILKKAA